ncbi:hypothetical protein GGX14DRAFT_383916 [Mycena pura]|uniref:Uncharacterized protein n=1 Tax=Mycena pura TaxID=153505 RepID=A0AAD7E618_9AGAR|nr:hypothetical protein GGX14DRAFT_383916 [Mycena pura]
MSLAPFVQVAILLLSRFLRAPAHLILSGQSPGRLAFPVDLLNAIPRRAWLRAVLRRWPYFSRAPCDAFRPRDGDEFVHLFDMPYEAAQWDPRDGGVDDAGVCGGAAAAAVGKPAQARCVKMAYDGPREPRDPVLDALDADDWTFVAMPWWPRSVACCISWEVERRALEGLAFLHAHGVSTETSPRAHAAERARGRARGVDTLFMRRGAGKECGLGRRCTRHARARPAGGMPLGLSLTRSRGRASTAPCTIPPPFRAVRANCGSDLLLHGGVRQPRWPPDRHARVHGGPGHSREYPKTATAVPAVGHVARDLDGHGSGLGAVRVAAWACPSIPEQAWADLSRSRQAPPGKSFQFLGPGLLWPAQTC